MSVPTKKLYSWLWIAALLTSTVGLSVHRIYCYCVGTTTVSLFSAEAACDQTAGDDACCELPGATASDCCAAADADGCCAAGATGDHSRCMDQSTEVLQLKAEFLVEHPTEKSFDHPAWLEELPIFKRFFRPVICQVEPLPPSMPDPPPLAGRALCQRYQVFRN